MSRLKTRKKKKEGDESSTDDGYVLESNRSYDALILNSSDKSKNNFNRTQPRNKLSPNHDDTTNKQPPDSISHRTPQSRSITEMGRARRSNNDTIKEWFQQKGLMRFYPLFAKSHHSLPKFNIIDEGEGSGEAGSIVINVDHVDAAADLERKGDRSEEGASSSQRQRRLATQKKYVPLAGDSTPKEKPEGKRQSAALDPPPLETPQKQDIPQDIETPQHLQIALDLQTPSNLQNAPSLQNPQSQENTPNQETTTNQETPQNQEATSKQENTSNTQETQQVPENGEASSDTGTKTPRTEEVIPNRTVVLMEFLKKQQVHKFQTNLKPSTSLKQSTNISLVEEIVQPNSNSKVQKKHFISKEEVMYARDESKERALLFMKGPLDVIMDLVFLKKKDNFHLLFSHDSFLKVFFITFPTFISRRKFLNRIQSQFLESDEDDTCEAALEILKQWLLFQNGADFTSPKLQTAYKSFISAISSKGSRFPVYNEIMSLNGELNFSTEQEKPKRPLQDPPIKGAGAKRTTTGTIPEYTQPESRRGISITIPPAIATSPGLKKPPISPRQIDSPRLFHTAPSEGSHTDEKKRENEDKRQTTRKSRYPMWRLLSTDSYQVAVQITLICEKLLLAIPRKEFLKKASEPKNRIKKAPNVKKLLDFGEHLTGSIVCHILQFNSTEEQYMVWRFFVGVCKHLKRLNNFFAIEAIFGALTGPPMEKLKILQNRISTSLELPQFQSLKDMIVSEKHVAYIKARDEVPKGESIIPRLSIGGGMVDMAKLEEICPTYVENMQNNEKTWINWSKMTTMAKFITNILRWVEPPYLQRRFSFKLDEEIQSCILTSECWYNESANCRIAELKNSHHNHNKQIVENRDKPETTRTFTDIESLMGTVEFDEIYYATELLWTPKLNELSERDWKYIISATSSVTTEIEANSEIFHHRTDESLSLMYRLNSGSVKLEVPSEDAVQKPYVLTAPNCVGEFNLLFKHGDLNAKLVPQTNVSLNKIRIARLEQICSLDIKLARKLYFYLAWKLARRTKRILSNNLMRLSRDVPMAEISGKTKELDEADKRDIKLKQTFSFNDTLLREWNCKSLDWKLDGVFSITDHHFCFRSKGGKKYCKLEIAKICDITHKTGKLKIKTRENALSLRHFEDIPLENVAEICISIWKGDDYVVPDSQLDLTEEDWKLITKAARTTKHPPNSLITSQDDNEVRTIYKIVSGSCTAKSPSREFTLEEGDAFGENSFINGLSTKAYDVYTNNESCFVQKIDAYYLNVLFYFYPVLAGKFFRWIAMVLCSRLNTLGYL